MSSRAWAGWVLFGALCVAGSASAQQEGAGRISIMPGWRLTPNDYFAQHAAAAGFPLKHPSPGGPAVVASFGYGALAHLEIAIDLFFTEEQLALQNASKPLTNISYGGLAGLRTQPELGAGFSLSLAAETGFVLVNVSGGGQEATERVANGWAGELGVHYALSDLFTLGLEYRYLLARGWVGNVGSINGGGSWLGLAFSFKTAAQTPLSRDIR